MRAGQPFSVAGGPPGKQGMLHALLRDRLSGRSILAATTHLKAKRGQVCLSWLPALGSCWMEDDSDSCRHPPITCMCEVGWCRGYSSWPEDFVDSCCSPLQHKHV